MKPSKKSARPRVFIVEKMHTKKYACMDISWDLWVEDSKVRGIAINCCLGAGALKGRKGRHKWGLFVAEPSIMAGDGLQCEQQGGMPSCTGRKGQQTAFVSMLVRAHAAAPKHGHLVIFSSVQWQLTHSIAIQFRTKQQT
eukprot:749835-Pelagomonas_calceolata.AAC.2